jgi:hypothetical protein
MLKAMWKMLACTSVTVSSRHGCTYASCAWKASRFCTETDAGDQSDQVEHAGDDDQRVGDDGLSVDVRPRGAAASA